LRDGRDHRPMKHLLVLGILFAVAFAMVRARISHTPYVYDEADYMFAASLGMEDNWLDIGSMPLTEFVTIGRRRGADASQQTALSATARSASDPVVYRHWHGPLYYYWLTVLSNLKIDEHTTRSLSMIFPVLTVLAIYFGSVLILGGKEGMAAAILASALFLWSPVTLETSELAPHLMFVLWYICGLLALAKAAADGSRRYYYAAVVFAGLAFATMEVAFVLILVLAIFARWQRGLLDSDWRLVRNSAGILIGTILVAWPSGLLRLSFVKAYLVMLYLAVFRKGAWGDVTLAQTWAKRFAISPVEWSLFAVALVLLVVTGRNTGNRRERNGALTFLLFAGLMILSTLRVYAEGPRYTTPFLAAVDLFTAWMLGPVLARLTRSWQLYGALGAICCLLIWNSHRQMSGFRLGESLHPDATLIALRSSGLTEKTILAPRIDIPTLHYYFPQMRVEGYSSPSEIPGYRRDVHFDAIIFPDHSVEVGEPGSLH
jgi:Dolichyl-phosphate-mannose-protein mannosyltransferase